MLAPSSETFGVDVVAASAALAIGEVHADIRDLAPLHGRAGLVASLRRLSEVLAPSAEAFHQIKRLALQVAADDIAWGRTPLAAWRTFFVRDCGSLEPGRAEIRLRLGAPPAISLTDEDALATAVANRVLAQADDAFIAARERWELLEAAAQLQAKLWDDPRLSVSDDVRWRMRSGERGLRRLLAQRPPPSEPATVRGLWRRLLTGVGASG